MGGQGGSSQTGQPTDWDSGLRLAEPRDLDPDPHVLEIELEAKIAPVQLAPGKVVDAWTYNGVLPGPLIRAKAGDRLVVHFKNSLPTETTVHWHGIRLPVEMDGVPVHSQPAVKPGGTFTYEFVLPDAGTFWYHPHVRSNEQTSDGLYGALIVEDPAEAKGRFGDEVVLVLSDMSLTDDGKLGVHGSGGELGTLFGREGGALLVNGKLNPTLRVRKGVRQRWRVLDTAQSRYFWLQIDGHKFTRIGGDGGLLPKPIESDRLLLASAERADVAFLPDAEPGTKLPVKWVAFDRGYGTAYLRPDETMMTLEFAEGEATPTTLPPTGRTIAPIDLAGATRVAVKLTRNDVDGHLALGINGVAHHEMIEAKLGETQIWTIENEIDWAHPFHLHGFFFQVLDDAGKPIPEWKDTANVPQKGKLSIAVKYEDRPGHWMFHCHILDHAEAGMMGMLMLR